PGAGHPVDPGMLARDPLHGCPPKTPAAAIGSIAEVAQDSLIYVVGALLAAVIVAAVLYWRYPWLRPRRRFGTAAIATFVAWILWRVVLQLRPMSSNRRQSTGFLR